MERETPTACGCSGRGLELLGGSFHVPHTLAAYRAQLFASRYAIPIETAALVAALALGGCHV